MGISLQPFNHNGCVTIRIIMMVSMEKQTGPKGPFVFVSDCSRLNAPGCRKSAANWRRRRQEHRK